LAFRGPGDGRHHPDEEQRQDGAEQCHGENPTRSACRIRPHSAPATPPPFPSTAPARRANFPLVTTNLRGLLELRPLLLGLASR
jgi:hypothetical protein